MGFAGSAEGKMTDQGRAKSFAKRTKSQRSALPANPLVAERRSSDDEQLVQTLRQVKSLRTRRQARQHQVIEILRATGSARVRNAAALALADMRANQASEEIISLLSRPDTIGARGTLLYALDRLGSFVPLPTLTAIILEDPYEAREEALGLIDKHRARYSDRERRTALRHLRDGLAAVDDARARSAKSAIEYLTDR